MDSVNRGRAVITSTIVHHAFALSCIYTLCTISSQSFLFFLFGKAQKFISWNTHLGTKLGKWVASGVILLCFPLAIFNYMYNIPFYSLLVFM